MQTPFENNIIEGLVFLGKNTHIYLLGKSRPVGF